VSPDKSKSLLTIWHQYFDPKTPNHPSHPDNQISDVSDYPNTPGEPLSYDERRYLSTASVYRRILGEEYDWQEAVKLVLPHPHPPRLVEGKYDYDVESPSVAELIEAVHSNPKNTSQYLFSLYRNIPSPGVEKLPSRTRGALLRQMANPPNRRPVDVRRYLALVDDMIACNIPMSRSLWTTAISFAGRRSGKGRTKKRNIVRAIGLWQQMEHHANIEADEVVFNVLYDSAIKAGAFSIAERLEQEMIKREIPSTRYSLIPKLYYHAERQDLEGISRTFDDFVQSGNIVDTVILNGLLSAFLKAGDTETAEGIYERMLLAQNTRKNTSLPADITGHSLSTRFEIYRSTTKRLGRLLKLSDALKDHLPNHYRAFQESLPLTPDTRTFHILLRHYAITTGRFDKVLYIIRDMENTFKSPPRHMIYSTLFEGFSIHGKTKKQTWTANRLWLLWHSYVWALIDSRKSQDKLLPRLFNFGRPAQPSNTWVNPFRDEMDSVEAEAKSAKSADEKAEVAQTKGRLPATQNKAEATDELYMPLPSVDPNPEQNTSGKLETEMTFIESHAHADPHDQPGIKGKGDVIKQELSMEEYQRSEFLLNSKYLDNDLQDPELEHASRLEGNVENGVFVGRSTIIHVLRAFGTCTHPDDVIEAWEQLQQLWDPFHRNAVDVSIIRDELERQLQKNPL
jgi:pentatricopeptide repeat protein